MDINDLLAKIPLAEHIEFLKDRLAAAEKDKACAETDRDKAQTQQGRSDARVRDLERKLKQYEDAQAVVPPKAMRILEHLFDTSLVVSEPRLAGALGISEQEVKHYCSKLWGDGYVSSRQYGAMGPVAALPGDAEGWYIVHPNGSDLVIQKRESESS